MVVGHDPDLSALLSVLIGARGQVMRKGALATIEVLRPLRPGEGVLRWLLPPELLVERDPDA
jgi:phosphohistidine phosphatase SixA